MYFTENIGLLLWASLRAGGNTICLKRRELTDDFHLKLGIDSGGGSLKICLSLCCYENPEIKQEKHKCTGINKLIIIELAPKIIETYKNNRAMFEILQLYTICGVSSYTFAADLKLIMIILGLQSSSSCHPCAWCDVNSKNLQSKGELRSIKDISKWSTLWNEETGGNLKERKKYSKCTAKFTLLTFLIVIFCKF